MKITVNDKEQMIEEAMTVRQLLELKGFGNAPCAVEVNRRIVPKRKHEEYALHDGDRVEIVTLVGGG
jgi:sulfur carrier protein